MIDTIFLNIFNLSFIGSFSILAMLILRLFLKKVPKVFTNMLWLACFVRLVLPFSRISTLSIFPVNAKPITKNIIYDAIPSIDTGISSFDRFINARLPLGIEHASVNPMGIWMYVGSVVYIIGALVVMIIGILSMLKLKKRLSGSKHTSKNIYLSDAIEEAFVFGIVRPKIYLPISLTDNETEYIILHERIHIARADHVTRIIGYLILCLHWFNPLVWIAYILSGRDIEMSCDETVVKKMGEGVKKEYSNSLLNISVKGNFGITSLSFGAGEIKGRIKNILGYKKITIGATTLLAVILLIFTIFVFTSPSRIELPKINEIAYLEIEEYNDFVSVGPTKLTEESTKEMFLDIIKGARKTIRISTNELPSIPDYLSVRMVLDNGILRIYHIYEDNGLLYVEEPYVGIYSINKNKKIYDEFEEYWQKHK